MPTKIEQEVLGEEKNFSEDENFQGVR